MPDVGPNYSLPPGYFVQSGDTILPSQHNPPLEDLAAAMNARLLRNGTSPMTGTLQMNGNRITGLLAATSGAHAPRYDQVTPRSAFLLSVSTLTMAANEMVYATSASAAAKTPLTAFARTLLDDANAETARATLGVGNAATFNVVPITHGGTGATTAGVARANLGLANVVTTDTAQSIVGEKTFMATARMNVSGAGNAGDLLVAMQNGANVLTHRITAGGNYEMITAVGSALRLTSGGPGIIMNVGRGDVAIEASAQDGSDGAGVCFRATTNPTGNAMFFTTRLSGGGLGLGVRTDRVSVGRASIYVNTAADGTGGSVVSHAGQSAGDVGTYAMLRDNAVVGIRAPGAIVSGSNLQYATSDGDASGASPAGAWQLMGQTQDSGTTSRTSLWMRVS